MSFQDRPSYQRPTKSSSSPSVTPVRRNPGNVPLVRGLSPVRSPYYGKAQELETQRSHDNPLFRSNASDAGERRSGRAVPDNNCTKIVRNTNENEETEERWKVHVEKGLHNSGGKAACTTPGKSTRVSTMQFTTPPKPVVKRKILSENIRDVAKPLSLSIPRRAEDSRGDAASTGCQDGSRIETEKRLSEANSEESDEQKSPMVSIEELQKRIQRFLQTEPCLEAPVSPVQCSESIRRFSGVVCGGSPEPSVEDGIASYHPVFSPYSPRPEFLRARTRSPSPVAIEAEEDETVTHDQSPIPALEKSTTPTSYDPKNNFLSPRPQFLRYRPLRRLELLRRSADALLDLDLDSPATDSPAESVKVESEKSASESQEILSVDSGGLTPPTEDADEDVRECKSEISQLNAGEGPSTEYHGTAEILSESIVLTSQLIENSVNDASQVDSAGTANDVVEKSEGELDPEVDELLEVDDTRSLPSRIFRSFAGLMGVFGFVVLVLAASGSPGLLPQPLHQNGLAKFWRTSDRAAPVRGFLQSLEGLWKEGSSEIGYPVNQYFMETLQTNLGEVAKVVTTFDSEVALNAAIEFYSFSASYIAPMSLHFARSYSNVRQWLMDAADSYISREPGVHEWDWVPEYDFVVEKDIFDWAEAYKTIVARVDSWEIKSIFQSHIESNGTKSIHELVEESSDVNDLHVVNPIVSEVRCASLHIQSANDESNSVTVVFQPPNNQFTQVLDEPPTLGEAEEPVLLGSPYQDNKEEFFQVSSPDLELIVVNNIVSSPSVTNDVEPTTLILNEDGSSATSSEDLGVTDSRLDDHEEAGVTSSSLTESRGNMLIPFDTVQTGPPEQSQHASEQLSQEGSSGAVENSNLPANQDALGPEDRSSRESAPQNMMVIDTEPKLASSSLLPRLKLAMSPAVLAAGLACIILAAVVAMIFLRPARGYSSQVLRTARNDARTRRGSIDENTAPVAKGKIPRKPQRTFKTTVTPQVVNSGSNYLPGNSPVPAKLSSEYADHFSTPTLFSEKRYSTPVADRNSLLSPERTFKPAMDRSSILSPEGPFKQISDKDSFMTPEIEILEDSSLGRFTALVPVVLNEGTEKEEVKLTPVRRSSRIRSRLQSPLSQFSYSPEL